jgi:cbb3-type cytochrome oxidase subunit 1
MWGKIMKASTLSLCSAVCLGIAGMIIGIIMAASGNHSVFPAHAHLNLLGWVSLFLIGIFYRLHPTIRADWHLPM